MIGTSLARSFRTPLGVDLSNNGVDSDIRSDQTEVAEPTPLQCVEADIEKLLARRLRAAVEPISLDASRSTFRELVINYDSAWKILQKCKSDWISFLGSVPLVDSQVQGTDRFDLVAQNSRTTQGNWKSALLDGLDWPRSTTTTAMEAKHSLLPIPAVSPILVKDISDKIDAIARQMSEHLTQLVVRKVCGLVEWYGPNACRYMFFVRQINSSESANLDEIRTKHSRKSKRSVRQTTVSGTHKKIVSWHIHDLVQAIEVHPGNTSMQVPSNRKAILDAVPEWLNGEVKIIEGTLIRELQIEEDLQSETWLETMEQSIPYDPDPAIVLGPYVLSGWKNEVMPQYHETNDGLQTKLIGHFQKLARSIGFNS